MARKLRELMNDVESAGLDAIDEVFVADDGGSVEVLREGKWIPGRFSANIRIDQPTHGAGEAHAHIYGRKGNEIGVVNKSGTASHGTKMKLHADDADTLRRAGFDIPLNNIVEWASLGSCPQFTLG